MLTQIGPKGVIFSNLWPPVAGGQQQGPQHNQLVKSASCQLAVGLPISWSTPSFNKRGWGVNKPARSKLKKNWSSIKLAQSVIANHLQFNGLAIYHHRPSSDEACQLADKEDIAWGGEGVNQPFCGFSISWYTLHERGRGGVKKPGRTQ